MNFNGCPYQNLFSLDLNVLREGASTTSHGNKFQAFTTLFENMFARTFSLDRFLKSLRPLLRVDISSLIVKNLSIGIRSIWFTIVNFNNIVLSLLYSKDGIPSFFSLSLYGRCFKQLTILVARLCIFSSTTASFLYIGDQTVVAYSTCGRTKDL